MEGEDSVVHFSLEDETTPSEKKFFWQKPTTSPEPINADLDSDLLQDVEILDAQLVSKATGIFHVEWLYPWHGLPRLCG